MSICNLVVQPHAAYLVSDSGYFDADGRILRLMPKTIAIPEAAAVIGVVGYGLPMCHVQIELPELLKREKFSFGLFIRLVRNIYDRNSYDPSEHYSRWQAAIFCPRERRPIGLSFFTSPADGASGQQPWTWYKVRSLVMPRVMPSQWLSVSRENIALADPELFDAENDWLPLIQAQQRFEFPRGGRMVAGEVWLSKVSEFGISERMLCDLGGEIGECAP